MNAVVDTNVVAYYVLGSEPFASECRDFWKFIDAVYAPASWHAELLSVLWMAVRSKVITTEDSAAKLRLASRLGVRAVPIHQLSRGTLIRSIQASISPYDCLFVELALRRKLKLATFDEHVIRAFPSVARRPSTFL